MAISERCKETCKECQKCLSLGRSFSMRPLSAIKLIEELSTAEEQLAASRQEFYNYRKSAAATEVIAHPALDDLQRAKLAIEDEQRAFRQYEAESKATIDDRDRVIAELKVALHDIAGGTYSHSACVRGRELQQAFQEQLKAANATRA